MKISISTALPTKTFKVLYHVGTMNLSNKRSDSLEGSGLSVSTHPEAWRRIARGHVTGDTYKLTKANNKFIDAHKLTKAQKKLINKWACDNDLLSPIKSVRVSWFDDELDDTVYQEFESIQEAQNEYGEELENYEVENIDGYKPSNKLKHLTNNPRLTPTGVFDYVLPIYAEDFDYDGVWWQDTLDVFRYSAPRGVIVLSKIKDWSITKQNASTSSENRLPYYGNCTQFSEYDTDKKGGLSDMIANAIDISFKTFRSKVDDNDWNQLVKGLKYDKDFKIQDDYAVSFKRSKLFGKVVYYVRHSSIEYIFGNI